MTDLSSRALELTTPPKGILAADESTASADKRLQSYGIGTGTDMRQKFRDLFLSTPGIEEYISGVILYEETLGQKSRSGKTFAELLKEKGIMVGIKVDEGTEPMPEHPDELITKGLIGLPERLAKYRDEHGASFTKWRAVIRIEGDKLPSSAAMVENAKRLASYACEVQRAGLVPILEPEVLYDGTHSRLRSQEVIESVLGTLVHQIAEQCADPSAIIIKSGMALSGKETGRRDTPEEVAESTLTAFLAAVPKEIPGIVFLSGGQGDDQATENLRAIQALAKKKEVPWNLTFSYSRALQDEALKAWQGKDENVEAAREAFLARLRKVAGTFAG